MADPTTDDNLASTSGADEAATNKASFIRGILSNSLAVAILFGVAQITPFMILPVLVAVGIQLAVFAFHGLPKLSEKYYDLSGSATHFAVVAASIGNPGPHTACPPWCSVLVLCAGALSWCSVMVLTLPSLCLWTARCPGGASAQQVLIGLLSTVWMVRLGTFLYLRILRDGRDPRFDDLKRVPLRFLGAWMLQACWVVLVQMPIILISSVKDTTPLWASFINVLLLLVWACAFVLESMADVEKFEFRQNQVSLMA